MNEIEVFKEYVVRRIKNAKSNLDNTEDSISEMYYGVICNYFCIPEIIINIMRYYL